MDIITIFNGETWSAHTKQHPTIVVVDEDRDRAIGMLVDQLMELRLVAGTITRLAPIENTVRYEDLPTPAPKV